MPKKAPSTKSAAKPKKAASTTTTKKTAAKKTTTKTTSTTKTKTYSKSYEFKKVGSNLVIVESPAKAKTISSFLGKDFDVQASMGHIEDLPQKKFGVDIKNWFEPVYEISPDKTKIVSALKKIAPSYEQIWLATDEDREWEAIAYHICRVLKLDAKKTPRIVFHEITKEAITNAVKNARKLDMQLVEAQLGRRILDRIVWFKVSPILWIKIKRWLSAGRVQSVAVKLIVEKEREIQNFKPEESRKITALLDKNIETILTKINGKSPNIKDVKDLEKSLKTLWFDIKDFTESKDKKTWYITYSADLKNNFELQDISKKEVAKSPPAPFITSTLQQEASRRFGRPVKKVMMVAQKLYENWKITYMRTDSTNLSWLAISTAQKFIINQWWEKYSQVRQYKSKSKNAQEAHEAIRPTYIDKSPETVGLGWEEFKLYSLIRTRTVASQMSAAKIEQTTYIFSHDDQSQRTAKWEVIKFDWFLKLYDVVEDENEEWSKKLPELAKWDILKSKQINCNQNFSKPPARYTQASLVKKLESEWIWRPSTYAPIITTIMQRWYVVQEDDKKLHPTEIAFIVTDFLDKFFKKIMDYKFTAKLEDELDDISNGKVQWQKMLWDFYQWFEKEMKEADSSEKENILAGKKCPKCWAELVYKFSWTGKFIWCSNYPECKYTEQSAEEKNLLDKLKEKYEWQPCPEWGEIVVKIWRFGPFLTSSLYPKVKRIKWIPDEKLEALEKEFGGKTCAKCGKGTMHVKKSRKWYFLACDKYPDCKNIENINKKK